MAWALHAARQREQPCLHMPGATWAACEGPTCCLPAAPQAWEGATPADRLVVREFFEAAKCAFTGRASPASVAPGVEFEGEEGFEDLAGAVRIPIPPSMHARMDEANRSALRNSFGSDTSLVISQDDME